MVAATDESRPLLPRDTGLSILIGGADRPFCAEPAGLHGEAVATTAIVRPEQVPQSRAASSRRI